MPYGNPLENLFRVYEQVIDIVESVSYCSVQKLYKIQLEPVTSCGQKASLSYCPNGYRSKTVPNTELETTWIWNRKMILLRIFEVCLLWCFIIVYSEIKIREKENLLSTYWFREQNKESWTKTQAHKLLHVLDDNRTAC